MTTVASGFCTSAPDPAAAASLGFVPMAIQGGHHDRPQPSQGAFAGCLRLRHAAGHQVLDRRTMTGPLSTAMPDRAMNPTAAEIENGAPRRNTACTPPTSASGTPIGHPGPR